MNPRLGLSVYACAFNPHAKVMTGRKGRCTEGTEGFWPGAGLAPGLFALPFPK